MTVRRVLAIVALALTPIAVACGVPTDDSATPIPDDELSDLLVSPPVTTTTTTTTTTVAPATTVVPTSAPDTSDPPPSDESTTTTTSTPPTTVSEPETVDISVYYPVAATDRMRAVERTVPRARADEQPLVSLAEEVVDELAFPTDLAALNLRTSVRPGLVATVDIDRGTATVTLDDAVLARMSETEERRAVAQLVLSLTTVQLPAVGGIGRVVFQTESGPYEVFVPAFNGTSEADEPLTYSDFARLVVTEPTATTTSTIAAPDDTVPATSVPDPTALADDDPGVDGGEGGDADPDGGAAGGEQGP